MGNYNFIIQVQPEKPTSLLEYRNSLKSWAKNCSIIKKFKIEDHILSADSYWNLLIETEKIQETYELFKPLVESFENKCKSNVSFDYPLTIVVAHGNDG